MAANSSAHPARAGFNQSGGAYFIVITDISGKLNVYTPGTGSGGAATAGTMTVTAATAIAPGLGSGVAAGAVAAGKLIKDMGKTVVVPTGGANSVNVTYRKFQVVQTPSATNAGGQMGKVPEYFSFYLEVARDGAQVAAPPAIARYF
jgi:hypothetical protein